MSVRVLFCLVPYPLAVSSSMFSGVDMMMLLFLSATVMILASEGGFEVWEACLGCFKSVDLLVCLRYLACLKFKCYRWEGAGFSSRVSVELSLVTLTTRLTNVLVVWSG